MIVRLVDGTTLPGMSWLGGSSGYIATEVTLTEADARVMWQMMHSDPAGFRTHMAQFLSRFPSNRAGGQ